MPDEISGVDANLPGSAQGRGFTILAAVSVMIAVSLMLFVVGMVRADARETARECAVGGITTALTEEQVPFPPRS